MSTASSETASTRPEVVIIGAGIGGLTLALLLEQIDVSYHIFERATSIRPLGASVLPVLDQLGMLEDFKKISLPCYTADMYNDKLETIGSLNMKGHDNLLGSQNLIFSRPQFYQLLLDRIPAHRISLGKKVLRTVEKEGRIRIHCSDNSTHETDILIGADGAYSSVRQSMFKRMEAENRLPKCDTESLTVASINMVGVAVPEDLSKYPQLKDPFSHFSVVIGGSGSRSWGITNTSGNQICWSLITQLSESDAKTMHFRNSEWGPESVEVMYKEYENLLCPWGGTMADVMKDTPKDQISKVYLEEKLFKTWYDGRTVLLGDACHKMLPGAGLGAVNAIHDAVVLANALYNMPDSTLGSITAAFQEYYNQRYRRLNAQLKRSKALSATMGGKTWFQRMTRHVMLNYVPKKISDSDFVRSMEYRPQVAWLPLAPNHGTGSVLPLFGKRELLQDRRKRLQRQSGHETQ
ncbi:hypothetical protein BGX34_007318 [Mortierella sp. NVP85]|nr:hypothetical protein BGX34_007318 [Mortierella sp. NVP85]